MAYENKNQVKELLERISQILATLQGRPIEGDIQDRYVELARWVITRVFVFVARVDNQTTTGNCTQ